ncbi:MFS transporter [Corynebacterium sp. 13CS0277]|nr:MFS transporter [Corynebacterium sp. 13CS0277]
MILLDQTIVAVATPDFQQELGADLNAVVWVTSIYLLTFAVPLLVTGRLGDRYGQRRVYMAGMALFTASSLACGLAPNIETLILARAVQGFGASLLTPQTMAVINRLFPRDKRGAAMGIWGAVAGLATLTGPLLGGFIVSAVGWQWIFFINVPIGVLSLVLVSLWVPKMQTMARSLDAASVVVSIAGVFAIVFSVQEGPNLGWPWWLFVILGLGVALIVWFLKLQASAQRRGAEALVPLAIFANHNFSMGVFSISMMGFASAGTMLPMMLYLQDSAGLSASRAGLMLAPMAVISGGLAPFVGRMSDTSHPRTLSMIGFGTMTLSMVALVVTMREGVPVVWVLVPIVLMGFGNAFVWSPNSATSMRDVPMSMVGAASGVYNTSRQVGSVVGAAVIGAAMQVGVAHTSYGNAMGLSMILPAIALLAGLVSVSRFTERA